MVKGRQGERVRSEIFLHLNLFFFFFIQSKWFFITSLNLFSPHFIYRLYVRGTILGYKRYQNTESLILSFDGLKWLYCCWWLIGFRSKSNQYPNTSLIQVEGVNTKEEVAWYCGKRMAYIYKAKVKKNGSHFRCIWGKVTRPHGNSGVVRAKFKSNLPPKSMVCLLVRLLLRSLLLRRYSDFFF